MKKLSSVQISEKLIAPFFSQKSSKNPVFTKISIIMDHDDDEIFCLTLAARPIKDKIRIQMDTKLEHSEVCALQYIFFDICSIR